MSQRKDLCAHGFRAGYDLVEVYSCYSTKKCSKCRQESSATWQEEEIRCYGQTRSTN